MNPWERPAPTYRKVSADTVPYGTDVCKHGNSVWAVYEDGKLIAIGASKAEAKKNYLRFIGRYGSVPRPEYNGRADRPHALRPDEEP